MSVCSVTIVWMSSSCFCYDRGSSGDGGEVWQTQRAGSGRTVVFLFTADMRPVVRFCWQYIWFAFRSGLLAPDQYRVILRERKCVVVVFSGGLEPHVCQCSFWACGIGFAASSRWFLTTSILLSNLDAYVLCVCAFMSSSGNAEVPAPAAGGKPAAGGTNPNSHHEEGTTAALERSALCAFHPREHHGHHSLLSSVPQQHSPRLDTHATFCLSSTRTVFTHSIWTVTI